MKCKEGKEIYYAITKEGKESMGAHQKISFLGPTIAK